MAKKITRIAKLQFQAGQAKPGPDLASLGIDMVGFTRQYNDATRELSGDIVPVVITAYDDRSFNFELKTVPASSLLKKAAKVSKGASNSLTEEAGQVTLAQVKEIAEYKMKDLNTSKIESAMNSIKGTAKNMGIKVVD